MPAALKEALPSIVELGGAKCKRQMDSPGGKHLLRA